MGNREDLLDGAKQCLLEKGYARTTARDIAAAAGVSTAAIGYHYGSREALLNTAMFQALEEWGTQVGQLIAERVATVTDPAERYEREWEGVITSFVTHRPLWIATIEAFLQSEHNPQLREQLAAGQREGLRSLTAGLTGRAVDEVSEHDVRTVGAVQTALISGLMFQWVSDPDHAPASAEVIAGLRALAQLATRRRDPAGSTSSG
ncbi:TetR/AcrR family transcriptional regulator [Micromonospora sp. BL4]|uniref:TetR/AcrR family transcriptional regulator n=1 Tax=Micromonospora sp. BL4 TaxID=2478710 RepID=UPI000EF5C456|nr:TetR/AcrR family transcriptional regulator [Micromonospora sp. BL4]RLP91350.1 TetR/AcrR family transcriptional regulator [Micromonospora sp. BL4]